MRLNQRAYGLLSAAVLAFGISGCSLTTDDAASSSILENAANSDYVNAGSHNNTVPPQISPLDEYLNLLWGTQLDPDTILREHEAFMVLSENLIAECMAHLGFTYIPHLDDATVAFQPADLRLDDPSWVSQWGYGLTSGQSLGPNMTPGHQVTTVGANGRGPNEQIVNEMTAAERRAWEVALSGGTVFDAEGNFSAELLEDILASAEHGCRVQAQMQAHQELDPQLESRQAVLNQFVDFQQILGDFRSRLLWGTDPITSDADHDWAACMADAGYPRFTSHLEPQISIWNMRESILRTIPDRSPTTPGDNQRLAELQETEIELALADLECRNRTNLAERHRAFVIEQETQFVEDHRETLAALRAAIEQLS